MSATEAPPKMSECSSGRRLSRWPLAIVSLICLIVWTPTLTHQVRLWTSEPYRLQTRLQQEEKYDSDQKVKQDRQLQVRRAHWDTENRGKVVDWPYHRTFIAYMPFGVSDLDPVVQGVLDLDGRRLAARDLVRRRLYPTPHQEPGNTEPRLVSNAGGVALLWSNGVVTALRANLPAFRLDARTQQYIYTEEFADPKRRSRYPLAPQLLIHDAVAVSSTYSSNFSLILRANGTVWAEGGNEYGQLGTDALSFSGVTEPVQGLRDVVAIAAGMRHALALTRDGEVWQWGQDDLPYGFRSHEFPGDNQDPAQRAPEGFNPTARPVDDLRNVVKIAAGGTASYAIDKNGFVWAWGGGSHCRLVPAEPENVVLKRPINHDRRMDFMVVAKPYRITELSDMVDIKVADTHAIALRKDGTVWGWGCNHVAQIGQAEFVKDRVMNNGSYQAKDRPRPIFGVSNVKQIFTSADFSAVVKNNGTLWYIGEGCSLCTAKIAEQYQYALKVKDSPRETRLIEFEASGTSGSYPRNSEWGIYWIDDSSGRVNGLAPWEQGYAQEALSPARAVTIFDRVVPHGTKKYLQASPGRLFAAYMISGGTVAQWRAGGARPNDQIAPYFSFPMSNSPSLDSVEIKLYPDGTQKRISVGWFGSDTGKGRLEIGEKVIVRGVRQLRYEELPNHEMTEAAWMPSTRQ